MTENLKMNCTEVETKLADLLLDPEAVPAKVQAHVAECDACRTQVAAMLITFVGLMTPSMLFSGMITPIASMDRSAQAIIPSST